MSNSTSSAEPKELSHYSTSAIHLDLDVLTTSHRLAGVLHQFEATCTEPAFRVRVSHVADMVGRHARTAEPVDRWVQVVGRGFRMADSRALPVHALPWLRFIFNGAMLPRLTPLGRLVAASQRGEFPNLFPMPVVLPSPIETPGIHANPHALNGAFNNVHNALGRALHSISRLIFALRWRRIIDVIRNPPWLHWPWPRLPWPSWPRITIPEKPGAWWGLLPFIPGNRWFAPKAPEIISPTPTPILTPTRETETPPQESAPVSVKPPPGKESQPVPKTVDEVKDKIEKEMGKLPNDENQSCAAWAQERIPILIGVSPGLLGGDTGAYNYINDYGVRDRRLGPNTIDAFKQNIEAGSMLVWDANTAGSRWAGHVAVVEAVVPGGVIISQANWDNDSSKSEVKFFSFEKLQQLGLYYVTATEIKRKQSGGK